MSQELLDTFPTHPLRSSGAARRLYAGGLAVQLLAWVALVGLAFGAVGSSSPFVSFIPVAFVACDHVGQLLRRRAWWHVPLRGAGRLPGRVELSFWTLSGLALVVAAMLSAARNPGSGFILWELFAIAVGIGALTTDRRPGPEPAGVWWYRAIPMYVAAIAVLTVGTVTAVVTPAAGVIAGIAAACLLLVTRLVATRRHPSHS